MWRKSVLLQFLLASLLLAGVAEARPDGAGGSRDLGRGGKGHVDWTRTWTGTAPRRVRLGDSRALVVQEGDVGSHIDPDGVRAHAWIDPNG